jgi:hypothetical protein
MYWTNHCVLDKSFRVICESIILYIKYFIKRYPITVPKALRRGRGIALLFPNLGTRRGEWSAPHSGCFTHRKNP